MIHLLAGNESIISKKYVFHYFSLSLFDLHLLYLKFSKGMGDSVNYRMHGFLKSVATLFMGCYAPRYVKLVKCSYIPF